MPRHVLIVDDEADLRDNLVRALNRVGLNALGAATPGDALATLVAGNIGLVCVDIHLADKDGLDFVQFVRGYHPKLPVIVMTGDDTEDNRRRADQLRAAYLPKPFPIGTFRSMVNHFVGEQPARVHPRTRRGPGHQPCRGAGRLMACLAEARPNRRGGH